MPMRRYAGGPVVKSVRSRGYGAARGELPVPRLPRPLRSALSGRNLIINKDSKSRIPYTVISLLYHHSIYCKVLYRLM